MKIKIKGLDVDLTTNCPPGLAKKNPPCVPPGLVRAAPVPHSHDHKDTHEHVESDHDHDAPDVVVRQTTTTNNTNNTNNTNVETNVEVNNRYQVDNSYTETNTYVQNNVQQITQVTTVEGDVIHVGDIITGAPQRYTVLENPEFFGLPPVVGNDMYLRVGDAAVQMDSNTQKVLTILALADVLIK